MLKHENQEEQNQAFKSDYLGANAQPISDSGLEAIGNSDLALKSGLVFLTRFERRTTATVLSSMAFLIAGLVPFYTIKLKILFSLLAMIFFVSFMYRQLACNPISRRHRKEYMNHPALFELSSLGKVLEKGRPQYIEPILSKVLPEITFENANLLTPFQRTKLSDCLKHVVEQSHFPNLKLTKSVSLPLGFKLLQAMEKLNDPVFIPDLLLCAKRKSSKSAEVRKLAEFAEAISEKLIKVKKIDIDPTKTEFEPVEIALQQPNQLAVESEKKILGHYLQNAHSGQRRFVALCLACSSCLISTFAAEHLDRVNGEFAGNPLPSVGICWGAIAIATILYFKVGDKLIRKRFAPKSVSNEEEELSIGLLQNPIHLSNLLVLSDQVLSILKEKQNDEVFRSISHILNSCSEKRPISATRKDRRILRGRISLYNDTDLLDSDCHHQFHLSILHALPIIGDESFLKQVRRYSEFQIRESNPQIAELKAAAQECLPKLEALVERQKSSGTLLRASSINEIGGGTLLRAATGQEESQPETLLRASIKPINKDAE